MMQQILDDIAAQMAIETERGKVADYIPQLAYVDPSQFGIAVATPDGQVYAAGDASTLFSIQSISKVFTLTIGLNKLGSELWTHVGREPSGDPFNSITILEYEAGRPRNPLINAGAIAVVDAIMMGRQPKTVMTEILQFVRSVSDDDSIGFDHKVAASEMQHRDRNAALAHFMKSFGNLEHEVDEILDIYFHQCSVAMSCEQLARAGLFLVSNGINQATGVKVIKPQQSRRINSLMMMCGHYDGSGEFAYRVGLPGKSGVGGGILTIAPGKGSIAVWSPGLNPVGNSKLGTKALQLLVEKTGWSVFSN